MVMTRSDTLCSRFRQKSDIVVDENVGVQLNPELWQNLPQDLLELVLSKLPVSRLAVFRRACKLWNLDIVPSAAARQSGECGECTVLYFDSFTPKRRGYPPIRWDVLLEESTGGSPWWMEVCKTRNDEESKSYPGRVHEFKLKAFPLPSDTEEIRLWVCERGLLFFGLMGQNDLKVLRDIIVCNPLSSKCKILGLPCPLLPPSEFYQIVPNAEVLIGMVFDSESGRYRFVAAGVDGTGKYLTCVYDSLKSAWTNVLSPLINLLELQYGDGQIDIHTGYNRSVCFNGNLYWLAEAWGKNLGASFFRRFVLKFDMQHDTWTPIRIPQQCSICVNFTRPWEMVLSKSGILLLHLHADAIRNPPFGCDLELEWAPEIKLVQRYTTNVVAMSPYFTAVVEASRNGMESLASWEHTTFSHDGNFVYHVLLKRDDGLRIIVQNMEDDSYKDLGLPGRGLIAAGYSYCFNSLKIWSFSPSLKSVP